jgi:D-sedoheptulose 7-phosphate isomerase
MSGQIITSYVELLKEQLDALPTETVEDWGRALQKVWREGRQFFLCGNGGSAANAIHLANDFLYGVSPDESPAMRVLALPANSSVLTCLGNDIGYDAIFSQQIETLGQEGDLLMVFSGSGNSPNVVKALKSASKMGIETYAILGFSGGICKSLADNVLHFEVDDMQVAEDLQVVIGHMLMKWLRENGRGQ